MRALPGSLGSKIPGSQIGSEKPSLQMKGFSMNELLKLGVNQDPTTSEFSEVSNWHTDPKLKKSNDIGCVCAHSLKFIICYFEKNNKTQVASRLCCVFFGFATSAYRKQLQGKPCSVQHQAQEWTSPILPLPQMQCPWVRRPWSGFNCKAIIKKKNSSNFPHAIFVSSPPSKKISFYTHCNLCQIDSYSTRADVVGADIGMELASKLWDTHVTISYQAVWSHLYSKAVIQWWQQDVTQFFCVTMKIATECGHVAQ